MYNYITLIFSTDVIEQHELIVTIKHYYFGGGFPFKLAYLLNRLIKKSRLVVQMIKIKSRTNGSLEKTRFH